MDCRPAARDHEASKQGYPLVASQGYTQVILILCNLVLRPGGESSPLGCHDVTHVKKVAAACCDFQQGCRDFRLALY